MFGIGKSSSQKRELTEQWYLDVGDYVIDLAWSPSGQQIAFVTVEGQAFLVDQATVKGELRPLGSHGGGASSVAWRFDGKELATAGQDGTVKIWSPATGQLIRELRAGADWVAKVVYHPQSPMLATAAGRIVRIWNADRQVQHESSTHASTIADIAWNPDGSSLAAAAYNGVTNHILKSLDRPRHYEWKGSSLKLAWSPTSKYIATGEQDSTVHFWSVKTGDDCQMWGFPSKVLELSWHHTGNYLATGGADTVTVWDCSGPGPRGRKPKMLEGHVTKLSQLVFQHRNDLLASGDTDGVVMIWNPLKSTQQVAGRYFESTISRLEWSPDNQMLAVGQRAGVVTGLRFQ